MSSELKNQQADPLWSSQLLTDSGSPTGKRGLVPLPSSHCDPTLGAQSDSSRNEFEPRPVSAIGLSIELGRESRSACDSRFHLLSPNQTPPFHGLLSYKRARENSMVGTQMEVSLGRGLCRRGLGSIPSFLRSWSFSEGRCSPSYLETLPSSGQEGWEGLCS